MVSLSKKSLIQDEALEIIYGAIKKISIEIYENDGKNGILASGSPALSNELFSLYNCEDTATPIINEDAAIKTAFTDPDGNTGFKLHYVVDTNTLTAGDKYIAVFKYDKDGVETDFTVVRFDLVGLDCPI